MSDLDFDDIHGDLAPALAEMSRLLRIVPFTPDPADHPAHAGEVGHTDKLR